MPFSEHGCSNPRRIAQLPDRYVNVYRCARDLHVLSVQALRSSLPQRLATLNASVARRSGRESDTLETRTKLTSYSALVLGGLPRQPFSHQTSRRIETLAGLNSRLEAVSGA